MNIDITKLKTIANYAKMKEVTPAAIYKQIRKGELSPIEVDGIKFIHQTLSKPQGAKTRPRR